MKNHHHGEDVTKFKSSIQENDKEFYKKIVSVLEELEYMVPFYNWKKKKQKECEKIYYDCEKRMIAYLVFGDNSHYKENIISSFVKIYASLIYKYINWYNYSDYRNLGYNSSELEAMIQSHFVDSVYKYIGKYAEVRTPFGSFIKKRLFIHFRGELQDNLRKIILYDKWKPVLYNTSESENDNIDKIQEYHSIESKMKMLKEYFLYEEPSQKIGQDPYFFHNFFFIYYFLEKKSLTKFTENTRINPGKFVDNIKSEINIFKDKLEENIFV